MSEIYLWLKWAHVVSSTVLFGMGAGIAFSNRSGSRCIVACVGHCRSTGAPLDGRGGSRDQFRPERDALEGRVV